MPKRPLPDHPSFEHLRKQAKRFRDQLHAGDADAVAGVREFHPRPDVALGRRSLADAQLVIARGYGFASWTALKRHVEAIAPHVWNPPAFPAHPTRVDVFLRLACLVYGEWRRSNPEQAARLLADDPELRAADIYCAATTGDVAAAALMIDREPGLVNAKGGPLGWEPLLYACYSRLDRQIVAGSTLDVARLLLSRGANPNAGMLWAGAYAFTALTGVFGRGEDWANQPPHPECEALARLLLDAGADPNDSQALYNRHFQSNDDHLRLLLEYGLGHDKHGPWLPLLTGDYSSPTWLLVIELCAAAQHGFFDRVRLLVEHDVDVNAVGPRNHRTAYEEARRNGHEAIADYLAKHGARQIAVDPGEAFARACVLGRRDEVRATLAADPGLIDRLGHYGRVSLIHRVVEARRIDGVRLMIELGVDINGMAPGTGLDRSVLHNVAGSGDLEMVKALLALGADPQLRDPTYHGAAIGWAGHNDQRHVVEHLMPLANLFDAVVWDGVERVETLLTADPGLAAAADADGLPLAFYLHPEMRRLEPMLRVLTSRGVDLNAPSRQGRTALDRALARGWTEFAAVLRAHGAREGHEPA